MKFLAILFGQFLSLINVCVAESYVNPWAIHLKLRCNRGDSLADTLEAARVAAQEAPLSAGSIYFRNTKIRFAKEAHWASDVKLQADAEYDGQIGPVIYSLLADYGLGFNFADIESGEGFEITVNRSNPVDIFVVFIVLPDEWVRIVRENGIQPVMDRLRISSESISEMSVCKQLKMACVRCRGTRTCLRLWTYANDSIQLPQLEKSMKR